MRRVVLALSAVLVSAVLAVSLSGCSSFGKVASKVNEVKEHITSSAPLTSKTFTASDLTVGEIAEPDSATVLVYMNGSDLESYDGEATTDISEMLASGIGENVNVVIETLGTSKWQNYGIASDHTQRYIVSNGKLKLVDDSLGQLDTTSAATLADFISWGVANYPAQRYMLLFWDHGGGSVYGFGYDEFQGDYAALTLDEIQDALAANPDVHFDLIGMDCCLMSSLEVCCVLAPFCDYAVLSEDFEPGLGWSYTGWMSAFEDNPAIGTVELGTAIVDEMIEDVSSNRQYGEATLALIDESLAPLLYSTWVDFAYENKSALLGTNYSQETMQQRGRLTSDARTTRPGGPGSWGGHDGHDGWGSWGGYGGWGGYDGWGGNWDYDASYVTMSDYYVTDIMAVASSIKTEKSAALESAVSNAIVRYNCTSGEMGMTGIGVTLPYGDADFYDELVRVYTACGFDRGYIDWLEDFVSARGVDNFYDYEAFDDRWYGWDYFLDEFDWYEWAWSNEDLWGRYEDSGWYDDWYDDFGGGWFDFFYRY